MTAEEIRAIITADAELKALVPDVAAIKAELESRYVTVQPKLGGIGTIIEAIGQEEGPALLDALDAMRAQSSLFKWGWYLVERGDLDFGATTTRNLIDGLVVQTVISAEAGAKLKALAETPRQFSEPLIKRAIWSDSGEVLV